ncbi:MAG: PP2C family protein-serine/threonine phosphatase [Thermoanaerobaculia bacterium]
MRERSSRVPAGLVAASLTLLFVGSWAAFAWLPEWRTLPSEPDSRTLVASVRKDLASVGATLSHAQVSLGAPPSYERALRVLGSGSFPRAAEFGAGVSYRVEGTLEVPDVGSGSAEAVLSPRGELQQLTWMPGGFTSIFTAPVPAVVAAQQRFANRVGTLLMGELKPTGEVLSFPIPRGGSVEVHPLATAPGQPRENIVVRLNAGIDVQRGLRDRQAAEGFTADRLVRKLSVSGGPRIALFVLVAVLFGLLLFRRRLSFKIASILTALATLEMLITGFGTRTTIELPFVIAGQLTVLAFLFVLWSVSESLVRDTLPGFTTSLDVLSSRRLGPRAGVALVAGIAGGAALAGLRLLLSAGALRLRGSGVWPTEPSFSLPLFKGTEGAFFAGPYDTAVLVLFVALFRFVLRRERADVAGAILFALHLSVTMPLRPWLAAFAGALLVSIFFLFIFQRFGFASLLVAATCAGLFRDTLAAGRFASDSLPALFLGCLSLGTIAFLGALGAKRPSKEDETRIAAPEYVRRIESERRLKYEMDLLSRMQLELLPEHPPAVPGLDLSVRTVLATEAGGDLYDFIVDASGALWIAAGDVSGHGYSCGIQGAMVKASLSSLIKAGCVPSAILLEVDRVLRCGRRSRLFTSLALLKIDPKTGEGLLANAGHPFPLLLVEGKCREVAGSGLPLGQGPARVYTDSPVTLPPGGTLLFASDGLYEGPDRFDEPYGYERPSVVLESVGLWRRPAEAIVESLFTDWRLHVGEGAPADDTTIVVVRRPALSW